jgi:hypothetical protein
MVKGWKEDCYRTIAYRTVGMYGNEVMEITSRFANGVFIFNILSKRHKMGHSSSSKVSPNLET